MRKKRLRHTSSLLFILLLYASLILVGVLLISMGTGVYENVLSSMNRNDEARTASAYLMQKVRQNRDLGAVTSGTLDGQDAVILSQSIHGEEYCTYLYCCDGQLYELLARKDNTSLSAAAGSPVASLDEMTVSTSESGDLIVSFTTGGCGHRLRLRQDP